MKKTELIISELERLKKDYADGTFGEKWISDAIEEMKLMGKCINHKQYNVEKSNRYKQDNQSKRRGV